MVARYPQPDPTPTPIKLLDTLTNRYHVGIVHASSNEALDIEMPLSSRLAAGQRVRFIVADDARALLPRNAMRSALVRRVHTTPHARLRAHLAPAL